MSRHLLSPRRLVAPSWVIPGGIAENCRFLAGKVDEVGLLFLHTESSLAYTAKDLPPGLAALPLSFHAHLPVDLDWSCGSRAAGICLHLMDKAAFLGCTRAVLHPPVHEDGPNALKAFLKTWQAAGRSASSLMLENIRGCSLLPLLPLFDDYSLHVCLDMGHVLVYDQQELALCAPLMHRVALAHMHAPTGRPLADSHQALTSLDPAGRALAEKICQSLPEEAAIMLEIFDWQGIEESLPLLAQWLKRLGPA